MLRFAAVRSLSKIAMKHPDAVTRCNDDMEAMISDSNRSIATLAITTLLKTGREDSVERLLKQIESFMTEIGTSMKVVVIKAIRQLCMRYPRKSGVLLQFMHTCLRDEGDFEYKQALVNTILDLMDKLDGMKTAGLNALGEFIEDCEFPQLSKQVLHVLGTEAPSTGTPGRYIRYIFNRVILEVPSVRAAAVSGEYFRFLFLLPLSNLFHCLCHVLLYSKTPKQVFFNPINIFDSFTHSIYCFDNILFSFNFKIFLQLLLN